jgi:hypothetical protein
MVLLPRSFVVNLYAMKPRRLLFTILDFALFSAFRRRGNSDRRAAPGSVNAEETGATRTSNRSARDEALWQKALAIQRRAIVVDTHNDITTPMTNDDFDLGGLRRRLIAPTSSA